MVVAITGDMGTAAACKLKQATTLGADHIEVQVLRDLGTYTEAANSLAEMCNMIEHELAWPIHSFLNLITLMDKPDGSTRPIALLTMLYRLWTKVANLL